MFFLQVVLEDDAFFSGDKMSDIYVKGWLKVRSDLSDHITLALRPCHYHFLHHPVGWTLAGKISIIIIIVITIAIIGIIIIVTTIILWGGLDIDMGW